MRIRTPPSPAFDVLIDALAADRAEQTYSQMRRPGLTIEGLEAASEMVSNRALLSKGSREPEAPASLNPTIVDEHGADAEAILAKLGLEGCTTETEILALRREFALRNHPDRLPPAMQELATERMMAVNALLDRHLARLRRSNAQMAGKNPVR